MLNTTRKLILEVVGNANEAALQAALGSNLEAKVLPYASLGDFTLQLSICSDAIKQMVFKEAKVKLEKLGLTVLAAH